MNYLQGPQCGYPTQSYPTSHQGYNTTVIPLQQASTMQPRLNQPREPPMLTMSASDPEETGGSGCAVAGISRERMGACFKYTWIREWRYPSTQALLYVQQRLLDFLILYGLRQADMCEALGLVTTYMSLFLKDVHSSNLGSRRRAEMYCVLNEFFRLVDEEAFDMEAIFRVRARRRQADRTFRLPEESLLPNLPPDDPLDQSLIRPIPLFPGISRRHGGRLFRYSSVEEWRHPSSQEVAELRDRLLHLLSQAQVKAVDLADGLGLVAPYLVHFLSDPFHALVGKKRRGELFCVCTTYLRQLEIGQADLKHLQILRDLRQTSENTVRNSRAPAPVYKRGNVAASDKAAIMNPPTFNQYQTVHEPKAPNIVFSNTMNDGQMPPEPISHPLQPINVPGLKVGARAPLPPALAEEGLTNQEFSQLLLTGVPNSVPLDVAFSNHFAKLLQRVGQGGGDPRAVNEMPADWRGSDLLLYQHPENRQNVVPEVWPSESEIMLNQEFPPMHQLLQSGRAPTPPREARQALYGADFIDHAATSADQVFVSKDSSMADVWQWETIKQGLDQQGEVELPALPHWNPTLGSQELHLYRYLFSRWSEVISQACSVYQQKARETEGEAPDTLHTPAHDLLSEVLPTNWSANQVSHSGMGL